MHIPGLVGLEGLGLLGIDLWRRQPGQPAAFEQAHESRSAHARFDELVNHRQQIVQRQQHGAAQVDDQLLLRSVQRGLQAVQRMAGVKHPVPVPPTPDRVAPDAELPGQFVVAAYGILDRLSARGRGHGILVWAMIMTGSDELSILRSAYATPRAHAIAADDSSEANYPEPDS